MKEVTKLLINDFKIKQLNYDFMGYSLQREYCGKRGKKGKILIKEEYTKRVKLWIGISAWRISIAKYAVITIIAKMI